MKKAGVRRAVSDGVILKMTTDLFWGGVGCFIINLVAYSYALSRCN